MAAKSSDGNETYTAGLQTGTTAGAISTALGEVVTITNEIKCDNPKCVRPSHLLLGTPADNVRDMMRRKRASFQQPDSPRLSRTDKHRSKSVTDAQARLILSSPLSPEDLAQTMRVRELTIMLVRNGCGSWKKLRKRLATLETSTE